MFWMNDIMKRHWEENMWMGFGFFLGMSISLVALCVMCFIDINDQKKIRDEVNLSMPITLNQSIHKLELEIKINKIEGTTPDGSKAAMYNQYLNVILDGKKLKISSNMLMSNVNDYYIPKVKTIKGIDSKEYILLIFENSNYIYILNENGMCIGEINGSSYSSVIIKDTNKVLKCRNIYIDNICLIQNKNGKIVQYKYTIQNDKINSTILQSYKYDECIEI